MVLTASASRRRWLVARLLLFTSSLCLWTLPLNAQTANESLAGGLEGGPDECERRPLYLELDEAERALPAHCYTPREGTLSGGYWGWDFGVLSARPQTAARLGIGPAFATQWRFALELWDQFIVGVGVGVYAPADQRQFSEAVVDCSSYEGHIIEGSCSNEPYDQDSSVSAGFATAEVGYQFRFRPAVGASVAPGLSVGYLVSTAPIRSVGCEGCRKETLDADLSGGYLAPFFRVTVGQNGYLAFVLRSQWFFASDLQQMTLIGAEGGLP